MSTGVSAAEKAALLDAQCTAEFDDMVAAVERQHRKPNFAAVLATCREVDGDELCRLAAERQADAQDAADEARDCNGNARGYW